MKEKLSILVCSNNFGYMNNIIKYWRKSGHKVATIEALNSQQLRSDFINTYYFDTDLIWLEGGGDVSFCVLNEILPTLNNKQIPIMFRWHHDEMYKTVRVGDKQDIILKFINFNEIDKTLCITQKSLNFLYDKASIRKDKLDLLPLSIDLEKFSYNNKFRKSNSIASLNKYNRASSSIMLFNIFAKLKERNKEFYLKILSPFFEDQELSQQIGYLSDSYNLRKAYDFSIETAVQLDHYNREGIINGYLNTSEYFINCDFHKNGIGLSTLEAMASGCKVYSVDYPTLTYVPNFRNEQEAVDMILRPYTKSQEENYEYVKQNHSAELLANKSIDMMREVIEKKQNDIKNNKFSKLITNEFGNKIIINEEKSEKITNELVVPEEKDFNNECNMIALGNKEETEVKGVE